MATTVLPYHANAHAQECVMDYLMNSMTWTTCAQTLSRHLVRCAPSLLRPELGKFLNSRSG